MSITLRRGVQVTQIGNAHGLIAVWCDLQEAQDLADRFREDDGFRAEILAAIDRSYPEAEVDA